MLFYNIRLLILRKMRLNKKSDIRVWEYKYIFIYVLCHVFVFILNSYSKNSNFVLFLRHANISANCALFSLSRRIAKWKSCSYSVINYFSISLFILLSNSKTTYLDSHDTSRDASSDWYKYSIALICRYHVIIFLA